jgi:hypothetical protein
MIVYYSKYNSKNFHILLENIAFYLKKYNKATLVEDKNYTMVYSSKEYKLLDCELLIYYPETDTYKGISFADSHSPLIDFFIDRNKNGDLLLFSQHANTDIYNKINQNFNFKFTWKASIYVPSSPYFSLDEFYIKRTLKTELIDKFIFRGLVSSDSRTSAILLKENEWFTGPDILHSIENYYDDIINYKVGLSLPGTGELCYRDIEYMAMGIPMMRFKYVTDLNPPLIPNYHYISIDRIDTPEDFKFNGGIIATEQVGGERFVKEYIKRFLEVKDNTQFLKFISKNARKYYEDYLHSLTRLDHIISLLEE